MGPVAGIAPGILAVPDVVAIIPAYNEAEILEATLRHLGGQGIGVYLMDNWSTDDTAAIARSFLGKVVVGMELFPATRVDAGSSYHLLTLLRRKERLGLMLKGLGARWIMHHDADELRESPWPGTSLRDGLRRVEAEGYNAIDHVVLHFTPTDEKFVRGMAPAAHFQYFREDRNTQPGRHVKGWIQPKTLVDLATDGGHRVRFSGRRIYPIPFLLKHYSILSTAHGRRKVLLERKPRYTAECRALGWHTHYDGVRDETHRFVYGADDPGLQRYDEAAFKQALCERHAVPLGRNVFGGVRRALGRFFRRS